MVGAGVFDTKQFIRIIAIKITRNLFDVKLLASIALTVNDKAFTIFTFNRKVKDLLRVSDP